MLPQSVMYRGDRGGFGKGNLPPSIGYGTKIFEDKNEDKEVS